MSPEQFLPLMRDPLGAPIYPPILQALLVITFVLHFFFVTLAVGSSATGIYGSLQSDPRWQQLARIATRLTPNAIGLGVVSGIAPLLFVQTIYDPAWYAANALLGFWSVLFIFIVAIGYALAYFAYLDQKSSRRRIIASSFSLALLLLAGFIMHAIATVSIYPENWQAWYAPGGIIDTTGLSFHAIQVPRLVFVLPLSAGLSLAITLMLFAWYFQRRQDADPAFLSWVAELGRKLGLYLSPLYALFGVLWGLTQGAELGIAIPVTLILGIVGVLLWLYFRRLRDPVNQAVQALGVFAITLVLVGITREAIRSASLARFNYNIATYPYQSDWAGIIFFAITSVAGVVAVVYLAQVLYHSGSAPDGGEVPAKTESIGTWAIRLLGIWLGIFLLAGIWFSVQ